jgi:hypothetical protein
MLHPAESVASLASEPADPAIERQPHERDAPRDALVTHPDPTRYGDWEIKGRCIDF